MAATDSAVELIGRLEQDANRIAHVFGLRYRAIEPERPHVRRRLGVCYADGTIRIRLHHARSGRPLKYSSLVDTLCHELAHLRHFNHGRRFQALYRRILEHARRAGIYQPGPDPECELERRLERRLERGSERRLVPARGPGPERPPGVAVRAPERPAAPQQLALF